MLERALIVAVTVARGAELELKIGFVGEIVGACLTYENREDRAHRQ
jgi:hypothetical protein